MLIICPTPIGNLDDVTPRQRSALEGADLIACEDSRRTGKLLSLLGIERQDGSPRLVPYHEHNAREAVDELVGELTRGRRVVLVSDAGTPAISDPGYRLVRRAVEAQVEVTALPGPVAAMVALSASGLPTDSWQFYGFAPTSSDGRVATLEEADGAKMTSIYYESPKRIEALLEDVVAVCGADRAVCVGRELTKMHEEYVRGSAEEVRREFAGRDSVRGECVLVVGPGAAESGDSAAIQVDELIASMLDAGCRSRTIKDVVSQVHDVARSEMYDRIDEVRQKSGQDPKGD